MITRRSFGGSVAALALTACGHVRAGSATPPRAPSSRALTQARQFRGKVAVHSWFDLPVDARSRELSGIAWDATAGLLWAVQDAISGIVSLLPDEKLATWTFGPTIVLKLAFPVDLEGIGLVPDGFIVASEKGPRLLEIDRQGRLRRDIALPPHFATARTNKSLESLSMSPDGSHLFTTSETALGCDGPLPTGATGTHVRILRMTRDGSDAEEHAYLTDALPNGTGDYGVADLAAIAADELLVLERGWAHGFGNTARIYRVVLTDPRASCIATPTLGDDAPVLEKELLVDLGKLVTSGLPPTKQKQASALLDNYEGIAVGPVLPDGRGSLFVVSDDNNRPDQFARILVLAIG